MPRFVLLRHESPAGSPRPTHYDLMLEQGESLRTWSLPSVPVVGGEVSAEALTDHRREYLDYEGEVSGGRGTVTRVARGDYELLEETPTLVRLRLQAEHFAGELTLACQPAEPRRWHVSLTA